MSANLNHMTDEAIDYLFHLANTDKRAEGETGHAWEAYHALEAVRDEREARKSWRVTGQDTEGARIFSRWENAMDHVIQDLSERMQSLLADILSHNTTGSEAESVALLGQGVTDVQNAFKNLPTQIQGDGFTYTIERAS